MNSAAIGMVATVEAAAPAAPHQRWQSDLQEDAELSRIINPRRLE